MIQNAIRKAVERENLTKDEAKEVMAEMMSGQASESQIASFITAMRMKGESEDELVGFAKAMRDNATKISAPPGTVDLCGTGGDGAGTFNISTVASFVVAAAGVPVAKHGNRSMSSKSGSADLLMALGIPHDLDPQSAERSIAEIGMGFLFAPIFHRSMANVAVPRREIGVRTFFNILGPLANPAGVKRQLIGVYDGKMADKMAHVLRELGTEKALIVDSAGTDEITNIGLTNVVELSNGSVKHYEISPDMFGLKHARKEDLRGGTPNENARIALSILKGEKSPRSDAVAMNAAAAIYAAGAASDISEGLELSTLSLRNGDSLAKLKEYADFSERLETERQMSLPIDAFPDRRMTRETMTTRCGEMTARMLQRISNIEGGYGRLKLLDDTLFSEKSILSAISLMRLLSVVERSEGMPSGTMRRSSSSLSKNIESGDSISIIGEYKPSSPSMSPLSAPPEPQEAIDAYCKGGLAGISVLVEPRFFHGSQKLFSQFRSMVDLPMLFKDFVVSEEQVEAASMLGADAVLLISKALGRPFLENLIDRCVEKGMEPLVEIHDEFDMKKLRSCSNYDSVRLVGLNSRDLRSMKTDIGSIVKLRAMLKGDKLAIAESGIGSADDLKMLHGFDAALIGSLFMSSENLDGTLGEMVSTCSGVKR